MSSSTIMQSRLVSLVEAITNTAIGFVVTMSVYPIINRICGIEMNIGQATLSTFLFTIVSVIRGYVIRRFFNNMIPIKTFILKIVRHDIT